MLIKKDYSEELLLAKKICDELLAGNKNAIVELYKSYQKIFFNFAQRRIYNKDVGHIESVLTNFWLELLTAKAICSYQARASFKSYLMTILKRRVVDDNRKFEKYQLNVTTVDGDEKDTAPNPEDIVIKEQHKRIVKEALLMLLDNSPKDAALIRMNLSGLTYRQMAEKKLNDKKTDVDVIKKRTDSIKKQFTRKRTGSLAKFKICIDRCLEHHGLQAADLMN
ncbi:MAG: sigma-70 family RNA polymerase sigma factor [Desulfobacterales bacterium]|nr:sigma-70 family RNA polymerase sigma factor [Desulfobacterales bacterium]